MKSGFESYIVRRYEGTEDPWPLLLPQRSIWGPRRLPRGSVPTRLPSPKTGTRVYKIIFTGERYDKKELNLIKQMVRHSRGYFESFSVLRTLLIRLNNPLVTRRTLTTNSSPDRVTSQVTSEYYSDCDKHPEMCSIEWLWGFFRSFTRHRGKGVTWKWVQKFDYCRRVSGESDGNSVVPTTPQFLGSGPLLVEIPEKSQLLRT